MRNVLTEIIDRILFDRGFKKKSMTWFANNPEALLLVNLQKSRWSEQYYVNLAVWVKALGETKVPPKEHLCHVRRRLTSFGNDQVDKALDLANPELSELERKQVIETQLVERALPFLDECGTLDGLTKLYRAGDLRKAMVHKNLKLLMEL